MKILIVGLNHAPEQIGIGPYTAGLAQGLAEAGCEVEVIAGKPYYPEWRPRPGPGGVTRSEEGGTTVWRCPHYIPARPSGLKRIVHYLSFAARCLPVALARAAALRPDVVIAIAPALLAAPVALLAARRAGAASWLHIQDFEVEAAVATGLLGDGAAARLAGRFESAVLRRFDRVSSISKAMVARAVAKGVAPDRAVEIRNWAEDGLSASETGRAALRADLGLPAGRIALYSGNLAMKQGIGLLAEAARLLRDRRDITLLICGDGTGREELLRSCAGLDNVVIRGLQPRERLGELLALADVHLLPQIAEAADLVLPSKLTNMLASGRPVIATAAPGTALFEEVDGCGIATPPGDAAAFASAIKTLVDDRERAARFGVAARERAQARWSRQSILSRLHAELAVLSSARTRRADDHLTGELPEIPSA